MRFQTNFFNWRRVPLVLQSEAAECGLACLSMVATFFGHQTTLANLRKTYACGLQGLTLKQLMQVGETLRLVPNPVRLEVAELHKLQTPCILHWQLDHFVVLEKVTGKSLRILDPSIGRRRITSSQVAKAFTGVALELVPAADFRKKTQRNGLHLADLIAGAPGLRRSLLILLVLSLALQLLTLLLPFYSQLVIDHVVLRADYELLQLIVLAFALVAILQAILAMSRAWIIVAAATRLNLNWNARVFRHLLRLPLGFFEARHVGDIQSRFSSVASLQQLVTRQVVEAFVDGLMTITTFLVMFIYQAKLALLVVASVLVYFGIKLAMLIPMRVARQEMLVATANKEGFFLETLRGVLAIKTSCLETERQSVFMRRQVVSSNAQVRTSRLDVWQLGINQAIFSLQLIVVIWLGAIAIIDGAMTIGMLVAFLAYRALFTERAAALIDKAFEFRMAKIHLERLADIVETEPERLEAPALLLLPRRASLKLSTRNLGFRHSAAGPRLLQNVTMQIDAGEHLVLTGASGAGKTTLLKLLMGLLEPTQGEILVNNMPLGRFGLQRYRQHIAAVMQEDQLFSGSLIDNISLFDPQPNMEICRRCAWLADIDEMIDTLPLGFFSPIGDMGATLSGGQRQRVLLARALYRRPRILFLDEFTSHLDATSETRVYARLAKLPMTRVVVAHRQGSVARGARQIRVGIGGEVATISQTKA